MKMIEARQPKVTYEFIEQADDERRLRHVHEILIDPYVECLVRRVVVPSDEIGGVRPNSHIQHNTRTPTTDPSRPV